MITIVYWGLGVILALSGFWLLFTAILAIVKLGQDLIIFPKTQRIIKILYFVTLFTLSALLLIDVR